MLRRVTFAGIDFKFHILALLVANFERATVRRNHLDFQLAVGAVELGISRMISNAVLVANVSGNVMENSRVFPRKTRLIEASSRHLGKSLHFVVSLEVVHLVCRYGNAAGIARALMLIRPHFAGLSQHPADADWEDGYILRALDLLEALIKVELAETVESSADQNDVFVSLNSVQAVERVIESVEHVGFGEPGDTQHIQRAHDGGLVLCKVHE